MRAAIPRIGLDLRHVGRVPTGLGTYALNLARALVRLDPSSRYVIIRRPGVEAGLVTGANVEETILPGNPDTPRYLASGPAISRLRLDLYHCLYHYIPFRIAGPMVVTVHDLIWVDSPRLIRATRFGAVSRHASHWYARTMLPRALKRANHVIAISAATRCRAIDRYGLAPDRVTVVHHGVDREMFTPAKPTRAAPPYFLCLGNTKPYKNIETALAALAICAARRADVRLIVSGRGDAAGQLKALAAARGIADQVTFAGVASPSTLLELLRGATALLFPSLVEGFGLPVLEAMAAGCPVIASSAAAVAEVAGEAALLCPPRDAGAFAAAMQRLVDDPGLRLDLIARGHRRAAQFSWDECGRQTRAIYDAVLRTACES